HAVGGWLGAYRVTAKARFGCAFGCRDNVALHHHVNETFPIRGEPKRPIAALDHEVNGSCGRALRTTEGRKPPSIKPAQAAAGGKPQITARVLQHITYVVIRQSVGRCVGAQWELLGKQAGQTGDNRNPSELFGTTQTCSPLEESAGSQEIQEPCVPST